uniref:Lectin n=3 Tax=Polyandrocarpa misakiensis TaxID=7723 RepID=LECC_POLMI|nr:RecName: Full=Lectin [Polyandrocarpa misakiensis]1BYF_A Chain A, PROTEIN (POLYANDROCARPA LECTIN) [Polyandrocarpa misakiensis]1BYF_B Chain B, PROTEIN (POLYANDROCARPA LECTIN) [Polyandrocarpa misakiensis]1TLG_A Chain A, POLYANDROCARPA LECTIN [Polyandrocarpa misakiensis]1TLG_B Chain B, POLYANDROCARPA LECTIN [Polyandrocarpa misakiensis]
MDYEILFSDETMNYADAGTYCQSRGMALVSSAMRDSTMVKAILAFTEVKGHDYWVGADNLQDGAYNFLWNDGVSLPTDSDLWSPNEPSNPQSWQLCVQIWSKYNLLDDVGCGGARRVICEKELDD